MEAILKNLVEKKVSSDYFTDRLVQLTKKDLLTELDDTLEFLTYHRVEIQKEQKEIYSHLDWMTAFFHNLISIIDSTKTCPEQGKKYLELYQQYWDLLEQNPAIKILEEKTEYGFLGEQYKHITSGVKKLELIKEKLK